MVSVPTSRAAEEERKKMKSRFCRFLYLTLMGYSSDVGILVFVDKRRLQKHSKLSIKP